MKIAVIGSRNLRAINLENYINDGDEIVSGGARGADALGERYAKENGFKIERYPAHWEKYGKSAGPKRNEQMAKITDFVICFWDKKSLGTKSMIGFAKEYNKPIRIKYIKV